jgi:steroid delta-isomerase-like uncharacterized protein
VSEENKAVVRNLYEALNAGDFTKFADGLADDVVEHEEMPGMTPNKAGIVQFFQATAASISGMRMNVDEMIAEGDRVSVRGVMSGKHTGEFMGVPATGNQLSVPLADYFRIANGKVAEHWGVMDSGALMMQLGVVPPPGA